MSVVLGEPIVGGRFQTRTLYTRRLLFPSFRVIVTGYGIHRYDEVSVRRRLVEIETSCKRRNDQKADPSLRSGWQFEWSASF